MGRHGAPRRRRILLAEPPCRPDVRDGCLMGTDRRRGTMAHDVFISHSSEDKQIADAVCATIEGKGVRCWIAPRDEMPGDEWADSIVRAIGESRIMVLLFSSNANRSPQVRRETQLAFEKGIVVVPFRVEDVTPAEALKLYLGPVHWLDALTPPIEEHIERLAEKVRIILSRAGDRGRTRDAADDEAGQSRPKAVSGRGDWPREAGHDGIRADWIAAGILLCLLVLLAVAWGLRPQGGGGQAGPNPSVVAPDGGGDALLEAKLREADRVFNAGDHGKCADMLGAVIEQVERSGLPPERKVHAFHVYGTCLYDDKQMSKAIEIETRALQLSQSYKLAVQMVEAYEDRARAELGAERTGDAVKDYTSAIDLAREKSLGTAQAFHGRALAYERLGDYEKALADMVEAIRLDNNSERINVRDRIRGKLPR